MALSINECIAAKNGGYMPRRRPPRRTGLMGLFGLGAGPWDNYNHKQPVFDQCWQQYKGPALARSQAILSAIKRADQKISDAQNKLNGLRTQVEGLANQSPDDLEVQQLAQDVALADEKAQSLRMNLEGTFTQFTNLVNATPSNQCPLTGTLDDGSTYQQEAENIGAQAGKLVGDLRSRILSVGMAARQRAQQQAQVQQQQSQQVNTELERIRLEQQAEAERFAREQKAIQAQRDYEAEIRRQEQARLDQLEADRKARLAAEEARLQAAQARESEFQQQMLLLEQQRQEAELQFRRDQAEREAARQQRMEEQEALMQQLLFMQELSVQPGMPQAAPSPYGAPALPFAVPTPGAPGLPGPAGFYTPGAPAGPQTLFPAQLAPQGFPGYMPAAQPLPAWQQSVGIQAPMQQAGPGMQFASFNPGTELFGMGHYGQQVYQAARGGSRYPLPFGDSGLGAADQPVSNPQLRGALIEKGYNVFGPSTDANNRTYYTFESPDGRTWQVWGKDVIGAAARPVLDPGTQRIIYAPPPGGTPTEEPTDWRSIQEGIQSAIQTGVQAYQGISVGREQAKLVRQQRREEERAGAALPALSVQPSRMPGWVAPVGMAAIGLGLFAFLRGGKKK